MSSPMQQPSHATLEALLAHLQGVRQALRGWTARCPAHHDQQPSLSIDLGEQGQILLKCFAGCPLEAIVEAVGMTVADLFPKAPASSSEQTQHKHLTLLDLAQEKMLHWKYLFQLGVSEERAGVLRIPYHLPDGTPAPRHRLRTALAAREGSRWSKGKGQIVPYGLERLEAARKAGSLILVEGESDCWTLWFHGFAALGLPGAEMVGTLQESHVAGINTLYLLREPDAGGASFVKHLEQRLQNWQWQGKALVVSLTGAKDANALYKQDRQNFKAAFQQALERAEPLCLLPAPSAVSAQAKPTPFTLQDLLAKQLPPLRWAIPDILPEGLTLLAGKPKLGKSWLALSIALAIAAGGVALGKQPVTQGEVLYLALEDNERRLQSRAKQLLDAMSAVPHGIEFALHWPRLDQGGFQYLEEYLQAHPHVRLVIVDTWVKVSPQSQRHPHSQYESDYEALAPLKTLADTYRVSILAVHHLRKMAAADVLDEITGSTGLTGVVDGALILKRERGQSDATLFVTGRDIEQEQQFALTFDQLTAQWTLVGNAEDFKHTKERQEILDLLGEQLPAGMSAREVAETLHKNYHTTRSLLRKMEDAGDVRHTDNHYVAIPQDSNHHQRHQCHHRNHCNQCHQSTPSVPQLAASSTCVEEACTCTTDDADYSDYSDYSDDTDDAAERSSSRPVSTQEPVSAEKAACTAEPAGQCQVSENVLRSQADQDIAAPSTIDHPQAEQPEVPMPSTVMQGEDSKDHMAQETTNNAPKEEGTQNLLRGKRRCPRHPQARWVRYDPVGQAWCDKMDCWDCYRLMKLGEALGYPQLAAIGGTADNIEQGIEAWSCFVTSCSPFDVVVATQQAIASCQTLGVEVPDLSGEVPRLIPAG